ncbi:hypothetical protein ACFL1H_03580 [Nanoarchaeota archaeon]
MLLIPYKEEYTFMYDQDLHGFLKEEFKSRSRVQGLKIGKSWAGCTQGDFYLLPTVDIALRHFPSENVDDPFARLESYDRLQMKVEKSSLNPILDLRLRKTIRTIFDESIVLMHQQHLFSFLTGEKLMTYPIIVDKETFEISPQVHYLRPLMNGFDALYDKTIEAKENFKKAWSNAWSY